MAPRQQQKDMRKRKKKGEISDEIKESVDYVVKYNRRCKEKHKPSSIIKMQANGQFIIIRE